jgi:hypothetical protein
VSERTISAARVDESRAAIAAFDPVFLLRVLKPRHKLLLVSGFKRRQSTGSLAFLRKPREAWIALPRRGCDTLPEAHPIARVGAGAWHFGPLHHKTHISRREDS